MEVNTRLAVDLTLGGRTANGYHVVRRLTEDLGVHLLVYRNLDERSGISGQGVENSKGVPDVETGRIRAYFDVSSTHLCCGSYFEYLVISEEFLQALKDVIEFRAGEDKVPLGNIHVLHRLFPGGGHHLLRNKELQVASIILCTGQRDELLVEDGRLTLATQLLGREPSAIDLKHKVVRLVELNNLVVLTQQVVHADVRVLEVEAVLHLRQ